MTVLSVAAALSLAATCGQGLDAHLLVGIAVKESGLDTAAIHRNTNGSTDMGLMQVNSSNFAMLGLDAQSALDPCRSIEAAASLLKILSRYNTGSPSRGLDNGYAAKVVAAGYAVRALPAPTPPAITLQSQLTAFSVR